MTATSATESCASLLTTARHVRSIYKELTYMRRHTLNWNCKKREGFGIDLAVSYSIRKM